MTTNNKGPAKPHIYELDLLRPLIALTVVAVHVTAFTTGFYKTPTGVQLHYAVQDTIHWTRNVFLFITAFALTYVYYGRPFSARRFWAKRSMGVLLPYALWSIAYTWVNNSAHEPLAFARAAFQDILTGSASYQLYYIALTLQLYLVLPLFLRFLRRVAGHPWRTLSISFILQLIILYISYQYVQQGPLAASPSGSFLGEFENRFLLIYQFYFILGGLAALAIEPIRAFLLRHGKWIAGAFVLALAATLANYALQIQVYHTNYGLATAVLQPMTAVYSLAVLVFFGWLISGWARRPGPDGRPRGYRFWHLLSDASFGIYLAHAFILTAVLKWVVPLMPADWPGGLRVFFTWVLTATGAALVSIILLNIPILSRLVGRSTPWHPPKGAIAVQQWWGHRFPREHKVEPER